MSNIPSVIKNLKFRITQIEGYNAGLANESCEQQAKIAELEKELSSIVSGLFSENELAILKLEQQALACDWIYTKLPNYSSENLSVITARRLELVTQANALRNKSERL